MSDDRLIISPDTEREERLPPGQIITEKLPILQYGRVPQVDISKWKLNIYGCVEERKELTFEEFYNLPQHKVFCDIHCVTTWSKLGTTWEGVKSSEIKNLVNIQPEARFVILHSADGYTTNLQIEDFFEKDVIMATKLEGETLSEYYGYPVRLIVPQLYFWKSAKWITGVEFTENDRPGYWEARGYHNRGNPWIEERRSPDYEE